MLPWLVDGEIVRLSTWSACAVLGVAVATAAVAREARREGLPVGPLCVVGLFVLAPVLVALLDAGWGPLLVGALGAAAALVFAASRRLRVGAWTLGDVLAPAVPLGLVFGRLGCLGAGCCFGRAADWPTGWTVPWALRLYGRGALPDDLLAVPLHPAALYFIAGELGLFVLLSALRERRPAPGVVLLTGVSVHGIGHAALSVFRADGQPWLLGSWFTTSQGVGLATALVALAILWNRRARDRAPPDVPGALRDR